MRRLLTFIMAVALVSTIAACSSSSSGVDEAKDGDSQESTSLSEPDATEVITAETTEGKGSSLFYGAEWVENETTNGVPVPAFSVPAESVDVMNSEAGLNSVSGRWVGVPDNEIEEYIQAVKDAGFTNNAIEQSTSSSYLYSANDGEDLYDQDYRSISIDLVSTQSTSGDLSDPRLTITVSRTQLSG